MECYLDNSATTKVLPEVAELMHKLFLEDYGNTSSLHNKGFEAEKYIREARDTFSKILKCSPNEIVFTS
ncbi:MAG: aminotransferase class V-fold PLP-dependent enzyme, partial [Lachnospiraceae bacterium]|nr:aminotransferase class V-fold PLP-dependent enzyme [Lachnospiraceae bacterium]